MIKYLIYFLTLSLSFGATQTEIRKGSGGSGGGSYNFNSDDFTITGVTNVALNSNRIIWTNSAGLYHLIDWTKPITFGTNNVDYYGSDIPIVSGSFDGYDKFAAMRFEGTPVSTNTDAITILFDLDVNDSYAFSGVGSAAIGVQNYMRFTNAVDTAYNNTGSIGIISTTSASMGESIGVFGASWDNHINPSYGVVGYNIAVTGGSTNIGVFGSVKETDHTLSYQHIGGYFEVTRTAHNKLYESTALLVDSTDSGLPTAIFKSQGTNVFRINGDGYAEFEGPGFSEVQLLGASGTDIDMLSIDGGSYIHIEENGAGVLVSLDPGVSVSTTPFSLNSLKLHTSGNLLTLSNSNVLKNWFEYDGTLHANGIASYRSNLSAPTSITFPASTANWTNTTSANIELYIDNIGITGTAIMKNGTQILGGLITGYTMLLQPGEYFSETYTIGTPVARYSPL